MELFLNLAWLLLVIPAYWVWRRHDRRFGSHSSLLILGCALVVLFPAISATDDLHAARDAMEESSATKRSLKQGVPDKASAQTHNPTSPAQITLAFADQPCAEFCRLVPDESCFKTRRLPLGNLSGRAPPRSSLA